MTPSASPFHYPPVSPHNTLNIPNDPNGNQASGVTENKPEWREFSMAVVQGKLKIDRDLSHQQMQSLAEWLATAPAKLHSLEFSCKFPDGGFKALTEVLKVNLNLKVLSLRENGIDDDSVTLLAEALKINTSLAELDLGNNFIGDAGAALLSEALKVNTSLARLDLFRNVIGDAGAALLSEALKVNTSLAELDLGFNNIGGAGAASLSDGLKVNTGLARFSHTDSSIGDAGAASLSGALKVNRTLAKLDLGFNGIGDAGFATLSEALKVNTSLVKLCLDFNKTSDAGLASLSEALNVNKTLVKLGLPRCGEYGALNTPGLEPLKAELKTNRQLAKMRQDTRAFSVGLDLASGHQFPSELMPLIVKQMLDMPGIPKQDALFTLDGLHNSIMPPAEREGQLTTQPSPCTLV